MTMHTCHWPGCPKQVPSALWGCRAHWLTLPNEIRAQATNSFQSELAIDGRAVMFRPYGAWG
jgi:hypothetical protein